MSDVRNTSERGIWTAGSRTSVTTSSLTAVYSVAKSLFRQSQLKRIVDRKYSSLVFSSLSR